jgi:dihydroorotate dehydrogenase (fumarate)
MTDLIVGGVRMHQNLPIMLGAGVCKRTEQLAPYLREDLAAGAIVLGSVTPEPRSGNREEPLQWPETWEKFQDIGFGLNSFGMPNAGFKQVFEELQKLESPVPLIVSIAGFSVADFVVDLELFAELPNVAAIELNLGCPNVHEMKTIPIAYDLHDVEAVLQALEAIQSVKPVWLKLSPYITEDQKRFYASVVHKVPVDLTSVPTVHPSFPQELFKKLGSYRRFLKAVVFANTAPNVSVLDPATGKPATGPNGGKAGLSGDFLRALTIPLVQKARLALPGSIDVIGCGGVLTGADTLDYLGNGAQAVQCVSGPSWYGDGPRFFADLIGGSSELQSYLATLME